MTDEEIRALRLAWSAAPNICATELALADEALRRGEEIRDDVRVMRLKDDTIRDLGGCIARLKAALRFYADPTTYEQVDVLGCCPLSDDTDGSAYGKKARAALEAA